MILAENSYRPWASGGFQPGSECVKKIKQNNTEDKDADVRVLMRYSPAFKSPFTIPKACGAAELFAPHYV